MEKHSQDPTAALGCSESQEKTGFGFLGWPHTWVTMTFLQRAEHMSSVVRVPAPHGWQEEREGLGEDGVRGRGTNPQPLLPVNLAVKGAMCFLFVCLFFGEV